jgi:hypothetical protein
MGEQVWKINLGFFEIVFCTFHLGLRCVKRVAPPQTSFFDEEEEHLLKKEDFFFTRLKRSWSALGNLSSYVMNSLLQVTDQLFGNVDLVLSAVIPSVRAMNNPDWYFSSVFS